MLQFDAVSTRISTQTVRLFLNFRVLFLAHPLLAQSNAGELHLKIIGPDGKPIKASSQTGASSPQYRSMSRLAANSTRRKSVPSACKVMSKT
jgi:hypothetical protein